MSKIKENNPAENVQSEDPKTASLNEEHLNISLDYSKHPNLGKDLSKNAESAGEEFYNDILEDKILDIINNNKVLKINLDGVDGYSFKFLESSFGKLASNLKNKDSKIGAAIESKYKPQDLIQKIKYISDFNPYFEIIIKNIIDEKLKSNEGS